MRGIEDFVQEAAASRLDALLGRLDPPLARTLEDALAGRELGFAEGMRLAHTRELELAALVRVADQVRRDTVGDIITYVVNRNINFTNICFVGCSFCAFSRTAKEKDAYFLTLEQVGEKAADAWAQGATEVCVQGGLPRDMNGFVYRDLLRAIKERVPDIHIHAFSPMEVVYGVERTGLTLPDYLLMLKDNGLGTLPGTAAEILDDSIRTLISRQKLTTAQWVGVITTAHRLGIRSTATMMYGHVEKPEHWVRHLLLLRDIQKQTGGFTEFVPLGFVHFNTVLYRQGKARPGPTVEEHLKVHALARLLLRGWIDNIQVSWVKLGRALSQMCLRAGANDYGGTLMEENISRLAGATAGQFLSPDEFQERILELGRIPAERTTTYAIRRVFSALPGIKVGG
jgi:FO synthase